MLQRVFSSVADISLLVSPCLSLSSYAREDWIQRRSLLTLLMGAPKWDLHTGTANENAHCESSRYRFEILSDCEDSVIEVLNHPFSRVMWSIDPQTLSVQSCDSHTSQKISVQTFATQTEMMSVEDERNEGNTRTHQCSEGEGTS